MKRLLMILFTFGFLGGWALNSQAQSPSEAHSSASQEKPAEEQTYLKLFPAQETVQYALNSFSSTFHYPKLKSNETFFSNIKSGERYLTENEQRYLKEYIQKYYSSNSIHFQKIEAKSAPYFSTITKVFDQYGIPDDLKYLAVIESNLNTKARSYVGAVGTWQFMASTARLLGLTVNAQRDDRKDLYKSTVAAAKYLKQLHGMFDNWILAVAAYNSGPGRIQSAISSSNSNRFWDMKKYLPKESQNHVMKFLATAYIMKRFADFFGVDKKDIPFQFNFNPNPTTQATPEHLNLASVSLSGKYSLPVIAQYVSMDLRRIQTLNPGILKKMNKKEPSSYVLYLPADKMIKFKAHQNQIINESSDLFAEHQL